MKAGTVFGIQLLKTKFQRWLQFLPVPQMLLCMRRVEASFADILLRFAYIRYSGNAIEVT